MGTSHLYYYCKQIEVYFKSNETANMMAMYPGVVEATIEAKLYARRLINKGNSIF